MLITNGARSVLAPQARSGPSRPCPWVRSGSQHECMYGYFDMTARRSGSALRRRRWICGLLGARLCSHRRFLIHTRYFVDTKDCNKTRTHTHTYYISTFTHTKTNALCVYKYENINVCIHTCILMVVCRYECNVCLYACICACRYVHTYVCTHMGFGIVKLMF